MCHNSRTITDRSIVIAATGRFSRSRNSMVKTTFRYSNYKCPKSQSGILALKAKFSRDIIDHNSSSNRATDLIFGMYFHVFGYAEQDAPIHFAVSQVL